MRLRRIRELDVLAAVIAMIAAALSACAPDLGPAPKLKPIGDYQTSQSLKAPASDWPSDDWWKAYGDPQLDTLEAEALAGSPSLAEAEARVRQAEAQVQETGAARRPQVSGEASVNAVKESLNQGFPPQFQQFLPHGWHGQGRIGIDLQYQLDFFGKNRAALSAALSQAEAARAEAASARLQLSTAVASAYARLVQLYAGRDAAVQAVDVRQQTLNLVGQRLRNGMETRGAFSQEAATVPVSRGEIEALDRQIAVTRNQLAALLGEGPDRGVAIARPSVGTIRASGLPPDAGVGLVGRRPDIVAARARAEAAAKRIKVARADFYPNVNLTGFYGVQALGLNLLFNSNSQTGKFGPALTLPIFQGGRLEGAYRGARAEYDAAVASYDQTLADALREVADAVAGERSLAAQLTQARQALTSTEDAYRIAQLRYQGGLSPYLNVLTAENAVLAQRRTVADLEAQALSADVALVRALGGGFVADRTRLAAAK